MSSTANTVLGTKSETRKESHDSRHAKPPTGMDSSLDDLGLSCLCEQECSSVGEHEKDFDQGMVDRGHNISSSERIIRNIRTMGEYCNSRLFHKSKVKVCVGEKGLECVSNPYPRQYPRGHPRQ